MRFPRDFLALGLRYLDDASEETLDRTRSWSVDDATLEGVESDMVVVAVVLVVGSVGILRGEPNEDNHALIIQ